MPKLCVIADPFAADGFRMAGVDVHTVDSAEMARTEILRLAKAADVGLIAVDAAYYRALDARLRGSLDDLVKPVVIAIPSSSRAGPLDRRAQHIGELVRRAIGVRITVRGGG